LPKIGSGSGRIVYDFGEGMVLKLAKNTKGVAQNNIESDIGRYGDIQDIVASYNLRGFSFREFLNLKADISLKSYTLNEIIHNHVQIAQEICSQVKPLDYFQAYLQYGFYPFFLENRNFPKTC